MTTWWDWDKKAEDVGRAALGHVEPTKHRSRLRLQAKDRSPSGFNFKAVGRTKVRRYNGRPAGLPGGEAPGRRKRESPPLQRQGRKGPAIVTSLLVPKTGGMNTTKVNLVRWLKEEGARLKQGEGVVELETEKVNYELDAPVDGVLLKIMVPEPTEIEVGGLLGYIGEPGDAIPKG